MPAGDKGVASGRGEMQRTPESAKIFDTELKAMIDTHYNHPSIVMWVIFNEGHLRGVLAAYARYYNETRTHLALNKDAPFGRLIQQAGTITGVPHLGGLHHSFVRI